MADLRAVRARPSAVRQMSVLNVNIVTERLDGEAFDLVIATNVFVYYDVLEQALAMSNVEAMLKPGAFLLANFSAPSLTSVSLRPVETTTTVYRASAASAKTYSISSSGTHGALELSPKAPLLQKTTVIRRDDSA